MQEELKLDVLLLKKGALVLRAINHKLRQEILYLIDKHKQITVTEIYEKLKLEQSVASSHLAILRKAGFVKTTRDGQKMLYSIDKENIKKVHRKVYELLNKE